MNPNFLTDLSRVLGPFIGLGMFYGFARLVLWLVEDQLRASARQKEKLWQTDFLERKRELEELRHTPPSVQEAVEKVELILEQELYRDVSPGIQTFETLIAKDAKL